MPILPIIDLLILLGWSALAVGGAFKAVMITTSFRPSMFSMGPMDFLMLAGISFLFALTLAARTYVKATEPRLLAQRRAASTLRAVEDARENQESFLNAQPQAEQGYPSEEVARTQHS